MLPDLVLRDFQPCCNNWYVDPRIEARFEFGSRKDHPLWIIDGSTKRPYINSEFPRCTLILIALGSVLISTIMNVAEGIFKLLKIITFANFWLPIELITENKQKTVDISQKNYFKLIDFINKDVWNNSKAIKQIEAQFHIFKDQICLNWSQDYQFKARLCQTGIDLLFIVLIILTLIGRVVSAIYGLLSPRDGTKLYCSFERLQNATFVLAPCLQPAATCHGLGGDILDSDAL